MVNTSCIEGCLDVQSPAEKIQVRMRQWAESDKQFLRKLSMTEEERERFSAASTFSPMPRRARVTLPRTVCDESYFCRQRYLRSYPFTKNQTVAERAKHWLKETKNLKSKTRDHLKKASCCFVDSVFKSLFVCVRAK
ncbi:hypothetical protein Acr_05g0001910 [Actinidia rufa]|uniref:Uncharacterized protein n=1 Tax=Actinidia rufa TaxID=165716 RepID=A0A7J0EJU3_9ERIC|nr:hypothetical protein Acr_05g0001910 [Actinidia rufa]